MDHIKQNLSSGQCGYLGIHIRRSTARKNSAGSVVVDSLFTSASISVGFL